MKPYNYHMPTEVIFAVGSFDRLGEQITRFGKRPFIVTGKHSARATGLLDRALAQSPEAVVFDAVEENPGPEICETGAAQCREARCDCIIALGGGSPIDAAKAIAILAANGGTCENYFGRDLYRTPALPIVAVPTTSGTGSEVTPYSVLVDQALGSKRTIAGADLFPRVALLDPKVTTTMPREVTVATGLDALSQGMEAYLSIKADPVSDVLALDACARIVRWLPLAADEPENLDARTEMLHAATVAGMAIAQTGTTLVHGMGYYLTVEHGITHGIANALLLSPIFRYNAEHAPDRILRLASAMGENGDRGPGATIARAVHLMLAKLKVSPAARDHGVPETRLAEFARHIGSDPYRLKNQIGKPTAEEIQAFYEEAWAGR